MAMNISEYWKRGAKAAVETGNLIAFFSILCVAAYLTEDWALFGFGLILELAYLLCASKSTRYRGRLEKLEQRTSALPAPSEIEQLKREILERQKRLAELKQQARSRMEFYLDQLLLVVTVAGFVVILFFGFGKHLLNHRWPDLSHAQGWEAGAIGWTLLFLFYYVIKFRATRNVVIDKIIMGSILFIGYKLLSEAWKSMGRPLDHVLIVIAIGFFFLLIDVLNIIFHTDDEERTLSKHSLFWADLPMVVAFLVLGTYLLVHPDTENPEVFVAGVISCQLLMSNAVFVVMEFGLLGPPQTASAAELARAPERGSTEGPSGIFEEPVPIGAGIVKSAPTEPTASPRLDSSVLGVK
jgi:hypothetical protein